MKSTHCWGRRVRRTGVGAKNDRYDDAAYPRSSPGRRRGKPAATERPASPTPRPEPGRRAATAGSWIEQPAAPQAAPQGRHRRRRRTSAACACRQRRPIGHCLAHIGGHAPVARDFCGDWHGLRLRKAAPLRWERAIPLRDCGDRDRQCCGAWLWGQPRSCAGEQRCTLDRGAPAPGCGHNAEAAHGFRGGIRGRSRRFAIVAHSAYAARGKQGGRPWRMTPMLPLSWPGFARSTAPPWTEQRDPAGAGHGLPRVHRRQDGDRRPLAGDTGARSRRRYQRADLRRAPLRRERRLCPA